MVVLLADLWCNTSATVPGVAPIVPGVAVDFVVALRGLGHAGALPWVHGALGAWCSGACRGSMQCAGMRRVDGHVV
jgi:hypothetical protein